MAWWLVGWIMLSPGTGAAQSFFDPSPHTAVYDVGGTVIFKNGATTPCQKIVVRLRTDSAQFSRGELAGQHVCYQPDGFMTFDGRDISAVKSIAPPRYLYSGHRQ